METERNNFVYIDFELEELEDLLKKCRDVRKPFSKLFQDISNKKLISFALQMYIRKRERILRNKLKKVKNERVA